MLNISRIQIGHVTEGSITDKRPNICFSLESDVTGEALKSAIISCGDWSVETTDQLNTIYDGPWQPFTEYTIHIKAIGTSGEIAEADAAFFTGRLDTPWTAKWITDENYSFAQGTSPLPMVFQKNFSVSKPLSRAWINSTALGVYELAINGQKVGQDYFAPGFTSYAHQIQYQTYDLKPLLQDKNQLTVTVAGGWAASPFTMKRESHISCDRQAFLGEIHLEYEDGSTEIIGTDESWQVTEDSPYTLAEWYDGETFDATFEASKAIWKNATITAPRGEPRLLAQYGPPVRAHQVLTPITCTKAPGGEWIYDFGQNFSGVVSLKIKNADKGQKITIRHAEVLVEGELFVKPLRTAKATLTYICIEGDQAYSPRFTYPSAYFRVYVKAIRLSTDSNESFVESIASLTDTCETIELKPMRIKDNSAYEALLHKGASFFFVSDSDAYSRLFDYRNSDATFRKEWTSSLVFPIKKPHSSSEKHIIGFLCITSKNRLNNPQKNEKIMKLFPHIAEDLYEAVQYLEAKNTEGKG